MRTSVPVLLAALSLCVPARAQQQQISQEELIKLREEKLAKPVFKLAPWKTDYDAVRAEAKASGKPMFAYFSRSYAH